MDMYKFVPRVILIEDDPHVLRAVERLLRAVGVEAVPTHSCAAARLAAAQMSGPDLVIADWSLGDGDGVACATELRERYGCATLIYSAQPRPARAPEGIDAWVQKPGARGEIEHAVRALLDGRDRDLKRASTAG